MRYLPLTQTNRQEMLSALKLKAETQLFETLPGYQKETDAFNLPSHKTERQAENHLQHLAEKNQPLTQFNSFLGGGVYHHHIPSAVDYLIQRGEFMTAYTPYQPEVSQGTLQVLFEFQTQIARLTGMEVANASLYDGATAAAEAVMMAKRLNKKEHIIVSGNLHPHYKEVIETYLDLQDSHPEINAISLNNSENLISQITDQTSSVVVQCPDFLGHIADFRALSKTCHEKGALFIMVFTEPLALGLLPSFGEIGADIVVGEGHSLGMGLNFGGPGLGLFACKKEHLRQMPGRLCGETTDLNGKTGYVLTLAAREQHIRREKATSNICTNAGLCALAFSIHVSQLGETGYKKLAKLNHHLACILADKLANLKGIKVINQSFFNEFTIELPISADLFCQKMQEKGIIAGLPLSRFDQSDKIKNILIIAVTEMNEKEDINAYILATKEALS